MKFRKWFKGIAALTAAAMVMVNGGICAWAEPKGLSVVEGSTIKSRTGGFQAVFPEGYPVERGLRGNLQVSAEEGEGQSAWDFSISLGDIEEGQYMEAAGLMITGVDGSFSLEQEMNRLFSMDGVDPAYMTADVRSIAGQNWSHIFVNYGKAMADYMRMILLAAEIPVDAEDEQLLAEMEGSMMADAYMIQRGDQVYILLQSYSANMAPHAAQVIACLQPYTGQEGWVYSDEAGWQYMQENGQLLADSWVRDEDGLTYRLDGFGRIQYDAWIQENGRWKYVDSLGHMITAVTKTLDGVRYTFDDQGYMKEGSETAAIPFELGRIEGKTYKNDWADIQFTFPEAAELMLGDGTPYTYTLTGGEHVDPEDPELSYRVTFDIADADMELDRYLDMLKNEGEWTDYQVDYAGVMELGGYEYRVCKTSYLFSDGTAHHWDSYVRQVDDKIIDLTINYYDELKTQADSVIASVSRTGAQ